MKWIGIALAVVVVLIVGNSCVYSWWTNPRVIRELREDPQGERAQKVMLLTLPSGKAIPVNYVRDGGNVYAAADFPWWRELGEEGGPGSVLIRGEELHGHVRAVTDDPELRDSVFDRLRPSAPRFLGTLIVVKLDEPVAERMAAGGGGAAPAAGATLTGTRWMLRTLSGDDVQGESETPFLQLTEEEGSTLAFGSGGCNRFRGGCTVSGSSLEFGALASTRMACAPPVMFLESGFFRALSDTQRYEIRSTRLILFGAEGEVATFEAGDE
jgi:heat shock protein HslJ